MGKERAPGKERAKEDSSAQRSVVWACVANETGRIEVGLHPTRNVPARREAEICMIRLERRDKVCGKQCRDGLMILQGGCDVHPELQRTSWASGLTGGKFIIVTE